MMGGTVFWAIVVVAFFLVEAEGWVAVPSCSLGRPASPATYHCRNHRKNALLPLSHGARRFLPERGDLLALRASEQQPDKSEEEKEKAAKKEEKEKDEDELPPGLMPICLVLLPIFPQKALCDARF